MSRWSISDLMKGSNRGNGKMRERYVKKGDDEGLEESSARRSILTHKTGTGD